MSGVKQIILISGKRKCGKDFVSEKMQKRLSDSRCQIVRISEPIKSEWSKKLNLSLKELLSDGPFKEKYRKDMIIWSEEVRLRDYGFFCRTAMQKADTEIVIVSDIRRKTDIQFFLETYGKDVIKTLRLTSSEITRAQRGWIYTAGIDDVASECDLDDYDQWDLILENNDELSSDQLIDLIFMKFQFS